MLFSRSVFFVFGNKKILKTCLGKVVIFVFCVSHVLKRPLFKEQKKGVLIVFHFLVNNCYPCFLFSFLAFCVFGDDSNEIL